MSYDIWVLDPPWRYQNWSDKKNGAAKAHYEGLSIEQLAAMPIKDTAQDNAVMFLWTTGPKLLEGDHNTLLQSWGFRTATMGFVWIKTTKDGSSWACGPGFYTQSNAEYVVIGVRGKVPRKQLGAHQIITSPRGKHSSKPREILNERIKKLYPDVYDDARKIELFARTPCQGWYCYGDEIDPFHDVTQDALWTQIIPRELGVANV